MTSASRRQRVIVTSLDVIVVVMMTSCQRAEPHDAVDSAMHVKHDARRRSAQACHGGLFYSRGEISSWFLPPCSQPRCLRPCVYTDDDTPQHARSLLLLLLLLLRRRRRRRQLAQVARCRALPTASMAVHPRTQTQRARSSAPANYVSVFSRPVFPINADRTGWGRHTNRSNYLSGYGTP